jgi:hypothetical protein
MSASDSSGFLERAREERLVGREVEVAVASEAEQDRALLAGLLRRHRPPRLPEHDARRQGAAQDAADSFTGGVLKRGKSSAEWIRNETRAHAE